MEQQNISAFDNPLEDAIQQFAELRNIPDLTESSQQTWNACLMFIYKALIRDKFYYKSRTSKRWQKYADYATEYSPEQIEELAYYYIEACSVYNKEVSLMGFSMLTGIVVDDISNWQDSAISSPLLFDVRKTLLQYQEDSLTSKLITGKGNLVGIITILNSRFGYSNQVNRLAENGLKLADNSEQLPVFRIEKKQ